MRNKLLDASIDRRLDAWATAQPGAEPSRETEQKIQAEIKRSLRPIKPLPPAGRLVAQFLAVFAASALALVALMSKTGLHLMTRAQIGSMAVILLAGAVVFSFTLVWRMIPGSRHFFPLVFAVAVCGLGVATGMGLLFSWRSSGGFVEEGWPCALMEGAICVLGATVFWLLARRGVLFYGAGLGAALEGLAGLLALAVQQTQCMFPQAPHLLVWHLGVAGVLTTLGALIGAASRRLRRS